MIANKSKEKTPIAECVWCECDLYESPTDRFWIGGDKYGKGICKECILSLAKQVLIQLEKE